MVAQWLGTPSLELATGYWFVALSQGTEEWQQVAKSCHLGALSTALCSTLLPKKEHEEECEETGPPDTVFPFPEDKA